MHIRKKRLGRPSNNYPKIDRGTKELQQKKAMLLAGNKENPALAESLLGIFYGHQLISRPLYEAGCFFGELGYRFEPCLDHKFRQTESILTHERLGSKGYSQSYRRGEQDEKCILSWRKALTALKQAGPMPYKVVLSVVFYHQDLYIVPFTHFMGASAPDLRKGLESLESYFREGLRAGQGKHYGRGLSPGRATSFQPTLREGRSYALP